MKHRFLLIVTMVLAAMQAAAQNYSVEPVTDTPAWKVDWSYNQARPDWQEPASAAASYENWTVVLVTLEDELKPYASADDLLAVFVGGELRGLASPAVIVGSTETDATSYLLKVWGNETGTDPISITLKYYNSQLKNLFSLTDDYSMDVELGIDEDFVPQLTQSSSKYPVAGTINVNGILSSAGIQTASGDKVAAFVGDECRGVSSEIDGLLTVHAHVAGETVTLKYYNATNDEVYTFQNVDVTYQANETFEMPATGKLSYCGSRSLDFSGTNEIKAYIATGYDGTSGNIWLTRVYDVPAGTPVLIKGDANKTYLVPVTNGKNAYYENMFKGNTTTETIQVGETEGDLVNYYLSGKDGTFKSVNKSVNIKPNRCYLQLPGSFAAPAAGEAQKLTMAATGKASYAASVDLDFTNVEGLKAFTATGYNRDGTIWLTRVMKVQRGEGMLLKGDANKEYEIPSVAVQCGYKNMFVGNIGSETITVGEKSDDGFWTYYYLSGKDGTFKSVNKSVNIKPNKSYLKLPSSMLSSAAATRDIDDCLLEEEPEVIAIPVAILRLAEETTGIKANGQKPTAKSQEYYSLQGQRVDNPGKGIYIQNGKKVVMK